MANPDIMLPMTQPIADTDTVHEASSIVILPVGSGDSSLLSKMILGLIQQTEIYQLFRKRFKYLISPNPTGYYAIIEDN